MEQIKLKKRETIIKNTIIHIFLSYIFLYLEYAFRHHLSPLSGTFIKKSVYLFGIPAGIFLVTIFLIWRFNRQALSLYSISVFFVLFKVIEGLVVDFNKIILLGLFCYIVVSYFLYQLLADYFSRAFVTPNYNQSDLFDPLLKKIDVMIEVNEKQINGYLTNWDEEGCFIKMQGEQPLHGVVKVIINFKDRDFEQLGEVVAHSRDLTGVGIKFYPSSKELNVFNWTEFIELVNELGFQAERLR
jgi:hypothetical protein